MTTINDRGQDALDAALDCLKVSTGLATGTLVFSIGLITPSATMSCRWTLLVGGALLALSIGSGFLAQASLPVMMLNKNYDLEHKPFSYPVRTHHICFFLGLLVMTFPIWSIFFQNADQAKVRTISQATEIAKTVIPQNFSVHKLEKAELIVGIDKNNPNECTWHLRFIGNLPEQSYGSIDVLVEAESKKTYHFVDVNRSKTKTRINLSADLLFDFGKATIRPEAETALEKETSSLLEDSNVQVLVEGHTDGKGSILFNQHLSERRAAAIADWIVGKRKIDSSKIRTKGWGKSQPIAPNENADGSDNPNGRAKNRRVTITIQSAP